MKKQTIFSLLAGSTLALSAPYIFAGTISLQSNQMASILQNLRADGYVTVQKIKLDEGSYTAEVINVQGEKVKVRIDPHTAKVVDPTSTQVAINVADVAQKVEAAGYHTISMIEANNKDYEVEAIDKDGKQAKLKVDAYTGKVDEKLF